MVIGVNHRTAPVAVRERFWMTEEQRSAALTQLAKAEAIDEVVVVSTCNRTEFLLWTADASAASGSVLNFLTHEYGLKLCEWKHFYRKLDEIALAHVFRVAGGLDSMTIGEGEIAARIKEAWTLAHKAGTLGRNLDAVLLKAQAVAPQVRSEAGIVTSTPIPCVAVGLAKRIFGSLAERKVLLIGTGNMNTATAQCLRQSGVAELRVLGRNPERAQALGASNSAKAVAWEDRQEHLAWADIIICATASREVILTREQIARVAEHRDGAPMLLVDMGMPRNLDPSVRHIEGVFLYDIDQLAETSLTATAGSPAIEQAERLASAEAKGFFAKLLTERVTPTINALRKRLDELCLLELESFYAGLGYLSSEQREMVEAFASRLTQRIAGTLVHELKEPCEKVEQERLTAAVQRLFHLEQLERAAAQRRN